MKRHQELSERKRLCGEDTVRRLKAKEREETDPADIFVLDAEK